MGNGNYLETFLTQIYQPNSQSGKSDIKNRIIYYLFCQKYERTTMAISNCLFSPLLKIPVEFTVWCVSTKLSDNPRKYS